MKSVTPNPKKRGYLLPAGCKNLIDVLNGKSVNRSLEAVRVNGMIRAAKVRVIGVNGSQLGIMPLAETLKMAKSLSVDLIEIAPNIRTPICRLLDYGKWRYQMLRRKNPK